MCRFNDLQNVYIRAQIVWHEQNSNGRPKSTVCAH
jgi:hypothetical protein